MSNDELTHKQYAAREDVYTLAEGNVILQWPANIGRESADDLRVWLDLVIRKIIRVARNTVDTTEHVG